MMKTMPLGLLAVAGLMLTCASAAPAGDQDFKLINKTGFSIHALHVAPHSVDEWGEDILPEVLENGESLDVTFGRKSTHAHWDIRIEDKAGNSFTWESIDLLETSEVTLHYKDGKAWADLK